MQSPKLRVILSDDVISFLDVASVQCAFGCNNNYNRHFSTESTAKITNPNDSANGVFAAAANQMNNPAIGGSENAEASRYFSMESAFEEDFSPVAYDVQDQYFS